MPLIRRLPKRGFNNAAFRQHYAIVNLEHLKEFKAGTVINEQLLRDSKLIRGEFVGIKILGDGELKHGLTVEADKVSAGAREKIEKAGGTITLRDRRAETAAHLASQDAGNSEEKAKPAPAAKKRSKTKAAAIKKSPKKKAPKKR